MKKVFFNRVVLASLLAPLCVLLIPAFAWLLNFQDPGHSPQGYWRSALMLLPLAYGLTLIFGVPSFVYFRRRSRASAAAAAATGLVAVWVCVIAVVLLASGIERHPHVTYLGFALRMLAMAFLVTIPFQVVGVVVGVVFWMIARTPAPSRQP